LAEALIETAINSFHNIGAAAAIKGLDKSMGGELPMHEHFVLRFADARMTKLSKSADQIVSEWGDQWNDGSKGVMGPREVDEPSVLEAGSVVAQV
jgi:hypothetical protein